MSIYHFEINIQKDEYNSFVENHPNCNLLQSYQWADVKKNWDHLHTGVYDENHQLVAAGLVLIKSLPFGFTMFYLPRGPVLDYKNKPLLKYYFSELKRIAKKRHCLFIKFDPSIHVNDYSSKEYNENRYPDTELYLKIFKEIGAVHHGFTMKISDTIWKSSVRGIVSNPCSIGCPWSCGSFFCGIKKHAADSHDRRRGGSRFAGFCRGNLFGKRKRRN